MPHQGQIEDLQKALGIIEQFCFSFGFKVNINKTEMCVLGRSTPPGGEAPSDVDLVMSVCELNTEEKGEQV